MPLKHLLISVLEDLVCNIDRAIAEKFGISLSDLYCVAEIKTADEDALAIEATKLKKSGTAHVRGGLTKPVTNPPTGAVACWDAAWAEQMFLNRHYALAGELALAKAGLR